MYKPNSTSVLASTDNGRSEYIDTSVALGAERKSYVAVSDSGKGNSAARRLLTGIDIAIPGSVVPMSFRLTVVVPTGGTAAVDDTAITTATALFSKMLTNDSAQIDAAYILPSLKGVLTLADGS